MLAKTRTSPVLMDSKKETAALRASGVEVQSRAAAMARATLLAVLVLLSSMATGFYAVSKMGFSKVFFSWASRREWRAIEKCMWF